jgi:hypothetical protein
MVEQYNQSEGFMLAIGPPGTQNKISENYGFTKYITTEEFAALYPEVTYYVRFEYPSKERL